MNETQLKQAIREHLNTIGIPVWNSAVFSGGTKIGGYLKTGTVGLSDLSGVLPNGKALFIEVKIGKNKQQKEQVVFQKMVESLGAVYILAYSLDDVKHLAEQGVKA